MHERLQSFSARAFVVTMALASLLGPTARPAGAASADVLSAETLRSRLGERWTQWRTPSAIVHLPIGRMPAESEFEDLERAVGELAARLGVDGRALSTLRDDPILYFVVDDPALIGHFGVGDVEGLAYPGQRLIVSLHLPHEHELVHVLLHLALPGRGASNQPLLQEGLASLLGGNGVDGAFTVLARGDRVLDRGPVDLAGLWTGSGWRHGILDPYDRYAVAARFVDYLYRARGGWPRLRELARLLAGDSEAIDARPWSAVRTQIEGVYDLRWEDLLEDFERWRGEHPVGGLGEVAAPAAAPDLVSADERHLARLWASPEQWILAVRAQEGPLDAELYWGEEQAAPPSLALAPSSARRYRLQIDDEGLVLSDQRRNRTLMRWEWREADAMPASIVPRERVIRMGPEIVEGLPLPRPLGVWSRPTFDPR